jgi:hypothetical protein
VVLRRRRRRVGFRVRFRRWWWPRLARLFK